MRLSLAAMFWTKPHLIAVDEPTNYLDVETVEALAKALNTFRGGIVMIEPKTDFVERICNEKWHLEEPGLKLFAIGPTCGRPCPPILWVSLGFVQSRSGTRLAQISGRWCRVLQSGMGGRRDAARSRQTAAKFNDLFGHFGRNWPASGQGWLGWTWSELA